VVLKVQLHGIAKAIFSRRIGWAVLIVCLGMILLYAADQFLSKMICTNEVVSVTESPDHQLKAVVFHRECGATVGENSQVSVISRLGSLSEEEGNLFIEDAGHSDIVSLTVTLRWVGTRKLLILRDPGARVFKSKNKIFVPAWPPWQPVEVEYARSHV
jgi:hypothetical protein